MQFSYKRRSKISAIISGIVLSLPGSTVRAQDAGGLPPSRTQGQQDSSPDHFIVGLGTAYSPAYEGSAKYRALPLPAFDIKWGPFFANIGNGVGMDFIDTKYVTAGTGITFLPGYRAQDAPPRIGKLEVGAGGRVFVSLKAKGFIETIGATRAIVGGAKGVVADLNLSRPIALSPRLMLVPTIGTSWGDSEYNDRYFGVSVEQSVASGFPAFQPGSGFKDASIALSANYCLTRHLSVGVSAGATMLLGDVKDSPIVFHRTQPKGFLSMSYRFGS